MTDVHLRDAEISDDMVRVVWRDGSRSAFHAIWLFDNRPCGLHPKTWERLNDVSAVDLDVRAKTARVEDGRLSVTWCDGSRSAFDPDYLRRHRYDQDTRPQAPPKPDLWTAEIEDRLPEAGYDAVVSDDTALLSFLVTVRDTGFAIVRGMPETDWSCEHVAHRVAFTRETNFGRRFTVVSKPDPNNQAYTHDALVSHTDLANREMPPGVQFLHCLESGAEGGESILVDGFAAAEQLRAADPDAWDLLSRLELPHRFHDTEWDIRWKAPVISVDGDGAYREIRYNPGIAAPMDVRPDLVKPAYRALKVFAERIKDPANILRFKLAPGDMMVFNNRRVLHGRGAFDPNTGPRRLQGVYVDLDEWLSRIRVLNGDNLRH